MKEEPPKKDDTTFDKNTQLFLILSLLIVAFAVLITLVISS